MISPPITTAPTIKIYSGPQQTFLSNGPHDRRRMTAQDAAKAHTGYDRETREPRLGIFVLPARNGFVRIGYDNFKLSMNVREGLSERIASRWRAQVAELPKADLRRVLRRAHFSRSFAEFDVEARDVEAWKRELESILSNPESYESI